VSPKIAVTDHPEAERYELTVDGESAGLVSYGLSAGLITLRHTEVDPAREGQGLGGRLVAEVLDDARARGLRVRPLCPFVADFIEHHPEYADLVAAN
jgi:predicted GNAT family acetyltransferase